MGPDLTRVGSSNLAPFTSRSPKLCGQDGSPLSGWTQSLPVLDKLVVVVLVIKIKSLTLGWCHPAINLWQKNTVMVTTITRYCLLDRSCRGRWKGGQEDDQGGQVGKSEQQEEASHCMLLLLLLGHLADQDLEKSNWTK